MDRIKLINALNIIYESGLDKNKWQEVVQIITDLVGNDFKFAIQGHDVLLEKNIELIAENYDESFLQSYVEYYASKNPWLAPLNRVPIGKVVTASEVYLHSELEKTEFFNDWLSPQGMVDEGVGAVLYKDDTRMLALTSSYSYEKRELYEPVGRAVLNILAPHIRRSFEIQRTLNGKQLIDNDYTRILNVLPNPIMLLDRQGRIKFANIAAEKLMRQSKLIYLKSNRSIGFYDKLANKEMDNLFDRLRVSIFSYLDQPIKVNADDGSYFNIDIKLFSPDTEATGLFSDFIRHERPTTMLSLHGPYKASSSVEMRLSREFQLTPAEIKLACWFSEGYSLQQYAAANEVSINTVRNQMRSIMGKLGVNRQTQLLVVLTALGSKIA